MILGFFDVIAADNGGFIRNAASHTAEGTIGANCNIVITAKERVRKTMSVEVGFELPASLTAYVQEIIDLERDKFHRQSGVV